MSIRRLKRRNRNGAKVGEGLIEKVLKKDNKTNVARVQATLVDDLNSVKGFILKERYPEPLNLRPLTDPEEGKALSATARTWT